MFPGRGRVGTHGGAEQLRSRAGCQAKAVRLEVLGLGKALPWQLAAKSPRCDLSSWGRAGGGVRREQHAPPGCLG